MTYTLAQILEDKKLRIKLAETEFSFEDGNGVFSLDFQEQSILKNHRETFDRLCELGGEALLKKILAEGKTCLTDDPNAAKQGVRTIKGTDRFFLKTNAGAPTALASIFFGIAGWAAASDDFDMELVSCCIAGGEEETEESAEADFDFFAEPKETPADGWCYNGKLARIAKGRSASIITKNGKTCLFDEENREFISFAALDGLDSIMVEEMHVCEKLSGGNPDICYGYKYQLEEDGKWGFISGQLIQCIAPKFDDILVTNFTDYDYGISLLAWVKKEDDKIDMWKADAVEHFDEYDTQETDYWFPSELDEVGAKFYGLNAAYIPGEIAAVSRLSGQNEKGVIYFPDYSKEVALYFRKEQNGFSGLAADGWDEQWEASYEHGFWKFRLVQDDFAIAFCGEKIRKIPAWKNLNADICHMACSEVNAVNAVSCVYVDDEKGTYVVYKDGYYAVANLKIGRNLCLDRLLTPYAFTGAEVIGKYQVKVDLFGKKGVFDSIREEYIIPCDYESVSFDEYSECFTVRRMGFVGQLNARGEWRKHLQREEQ